MDTNFDFLKINPDTAVLFDTANKAEQNYIHEDYEGTLSKIRKIAENTVFIIAEKESIKLNERATFSDALYSIKRYIDQRIINIFYEIKGQGNLAVHKMNYSGANKETALKGLNDIHLILVWLMRKYLNSSINENVLQFLEPEVKNRYQTAERKFIYIQSVNNETGLFQAFEGVHKIGDGKIKEDNLEADWRPNSSFLREIAPKRINQYMTTSGLKYNLGWVELAYSKKNKTWFRDYEVHEVLKRSGIKNAKNLTGREWFETDLETAKKAIKAVKEGHSYLSDSTLPEYKKEIKLRPEQKEAVKLTKKVFDKNNSMLWNAKMRFGKTLTALQLIKEMSFKKILILSHRPIVSNSWFEDYEKMNLKESGYHFGSAKNGEKLNKLKYTQDKYIYFASIQLIRYGGGQVNLSEYTDVNWDLIVIDEAHEGTRTELSKTVLEKIITSNTKVLELTGTPFNLLQDYKEDQVYTWDYTMEQNEKLKWEIEKPFEKNPYEKLPKVSMYTFEMKGFNKFYEEAKSFNFKRFFSVNENGRFIYESDINKFLNNISRFDKKTNYPFSTKENREELRHTLWLLPGIKEANAFEKILNNHPLFGAEYKIVNVVRDSTRDDEEVSDNDIMKVRNAISSDPSKTKTITLTVRKLTTGINIPEWSAVIFLSNTNSPMNYLQAAFRAQTPFSHETLGIKKNCYIFDFAPDRALTILAESAQVNSGVGKRNTQEQINSLSNLLNFLPVLSISETGMKPYNVDNMLTQLKRVYAMKAVRTGFEDESIYNDKLLTLSNDEIHLFNDLKGIVGNANKKPINKVIVNETGLTDEEYDKGEKVSRKRKKDRTIEEEELLKKIRDARKQRKELISILRGVSIRIPMMIYGMEIDLQKDINITSFINNVDEKSWNEFMPKGFTKGMFKTISKYYDPEVFIEAGRIIRSKAKSYDKLDYIQRAEKIAELFSTFKNPDKETVLTPWNTVNRQLISTIGGLDFFQEYNDEYRVNQLEWKNTPIANYIYDEKTKFLDLDTKTGLYPLFIAISMYYKKIIDINDSKFDAEKIYTKILKENIFSIAKTPMAKTIAERTLMGYNLYDTNIVYLNNFSNVIKEDTDKGVNLINEVFDNMKFDVIIGNPPYSETIGKEGNESLSKQVFPSFIETAIKLNPKYITLITPSRWFSADAQDKSFVKLREFIKDNNHFAKIYNYPNSKLVFNSVEIAGGVNYFLYDSSYIGDVEFYEMSANSTEMIRRPLFEKNLDIIIPSNKLIKIIEKVTNHSGFESITKITKGRNAFGVVGKKSELYNLTSEIPFENSVEVRCAKEEIRYIKKENINKNIELVEKWKVFISKGNGGAGLITDEKKVNIIGKPYIGDNNSICSDSLIPIGSFDTQFEALSLQKYMKTKFFRTLVGTLKTSQNIYQNVYQFVPIQDFSNDSDVNWRNSIDELDIYFYEKYNLNDKEVSFIENKIKKME